MKTIIESKEYFNAIYEVQSKIRNKYKYETITKKEAAILEWVTDIICDELNDRKLAHYWNWEE